jgi:hypothetical protein
VDRVCVGRRSRQRTRRPDRPERALYYVIAVDAQGYIHVAGNTDDAPLRYIRSTAPDDITTWTAPGMVGDREDSVGYPRFVTVGYELLFDYRDGSDADGDWVLNA